MTELALSLTTRQWMTIDGCMDNAAALMNVDRPVSDHERPVHIRRAATGGEPEASSQAPGELMITIRLPPDEWRFVVDELSAVVPLYEETGDAEDLHDTVAAILRQLL